MADHIAAYGSYLEQEKHASPNTVSSYVRDLTQFRAWLPQGSDLRRVKPAAVEEYLAHLTDQGRSAATVTRSAASIKSFYHYLVLSGAMKASPAKGVAAAKVERKCPEILTGREVELFLEQPKCVDEKGYRDHAMLELMYATGVRVSELIALNVEDVNLPAAFLRCGDEKRERKGTVASIQNDVLKFKTSSVSYTMLDKYNTKDSDNTIKIGSTETQSKKLLTRLANDSAFELYAEIAADGNNKVTEVDARLTAATGKLVEYDQDKKRIKIETSGGEYELITTSKPKLTGEDDKKFTLDDIATSKYVGEEIKLGFNSSGVVNQFTLVNGPNVGSGLTKVSGIATSAANGLQVDGKSKAYSFLSERKMTLRVYGSPTESLDTVKKMIADPNVKVYVEAGLDDQERVETLNVYIREAAGELTSCDSDYIRIRTASGNKFSLDLPGKVKTCNVKGLKQEDLEDGNADNKGYTVKVVLTDAGVISSITG